MINEVIENSHLHLVLANTNLFTFSPNLIELLLEFLEFVDDF